MPSKHKHRPISFRPGLQRGDPDGDRAWLLDHAESTGQAVNRVLAKALHLYRTKYERNATSETRGDE
jgi:hypothetical protein